jgi:ABC-2 type transport system permease protein
MYFDNSCLVYGYLFAIQAGREKNTRFGNIRDLLNGWQNMINKFFVQIGFTYKGLFHWLNWPAYISNVFLRPAVMIVMWAILGKFAIGTQGAQILILGMSVQQMNVIVTGGLTQSYSNETDYKTLTFFYVSPVNRLENFISRAVLHYPNALMSFVASMISAWLIIGMNFGTVNWVGFILVVLVIAASTTAFAQFVGMYALASKEWIPIFNIAGNFIGLLTGAVIPISVFPSVIQEVARLLPITNGLFAVRAAFSGAPLGAIYGDILREALTGITYLLIAFIAFLYIETWSKRTGALSVDF